MTEQVFPARLSADPTDTIVFRGEWSQWTELNQISAEQRTIIGARAMFLVLWGQIS